MIPNPRIPPRAAPAVDVIVRATPWRRVADAETIVRDAIAAAASLCDAVPFDGEVAVVLADDSLARDLNKQWRRIDRPTNVLSFPAMPAPSVEEAPTALGDIVIAYETVEREAMLEGKTLGAHLAHLTVHGFLHLVGYDHRTDDEAADMEALETRILAELGLPDPYAEGTRRRAINR